MGLAYYTDRDAENAQQVLMLMCQLMVGRDVKLNSVLYDNRTWHVSSCNDFNELDVNRMDDSGNVIRMTVGLNAIRRIL